MNEKRGYWYLLSGVVIGLGLGLLIAWVLAPVQFSETTPASLRLDYKDQYRLMIASAYAADGDLPRARARLGLLAGGDQIAVLGNQSQRMLDGGSKVAEVQRLADLSSALQTAPTDTPTPEASFTPPASMTPLPSPTWTATTTPLPLTSTPTSTSVPSSTASPSASPSLTMTANVSPTLTPKPLSSSLPLASQTASATPEIRFQLSKQTNQCDPDQPGLLQVNLTLSGGKPAAGVELVITWVDGEDHFFTGLKPELGFGYADFTMTNNVEYALSIPDGGVRLTGLKAPKCTGGYAGSLRLEFKQP